jgi:nitrate reductase NapE component
MKKISEWYRGRFGHKTAALIVACLYVVLSCCLYLGPATFSCSDRLSAPPGDQSAGLIALNTIDSNDPWWGKTMVSNAPFGEVLGSAVHITSQTLFVPYWLFSKAVGAVCAYNALAVTGFVFSATVVYLFVLKLIGRRSLAFLAGFAFVFTPYLIIATGVHISYAFAGFFVLFAWAILNFVEKPNRKTAALVGSSVAAYFYTDIYFVYLGGVWALGILIGIAVAMLLARMPKKSSLKQLSLRYRSIWVSFAVVALALTPILAVRMIYGNEINSLVSSSRGEIVHEAGVYGARLREFLLPNAQQPELGALFGSAFTGRDLHGSNTGEATLSLSLTMIVITLLAIFKYIKTRDEPDRRLKLVFIIAAVAGVVGVLFSLPPTFHDIPTPTYLVVSVVSIWRVFARLHVVINLALVVSFIIALWYLLKNVRPKAYWLWYVLVLLLIFFEYRTFSLVKPTWSYSQDVPGAYHWLAQQTNIRRIAIYPLDEQSRTIYPTYYNSFQRVHGKQTLNSYLPNSPQTSLRNALRDLDAPQTAPALRTLGIDVVVVNTPTQPNLPARDYQLLYRSNGISPGMVKNDTWIYKVLDGTKAVEVLVPGKGFVTLNTMSPTDITYEVKDNAQLQLVDLPQAKACRSLTSTFTLSSDTKPGMRDVIIEQNQKILARIAVTGHAEMVTIRHDNSTVDIGIMNPSVGGVNISNLGTGCNT